MHGVPEVVARGVRADMMELCSECGEGGERAGDRIDFDQLEMRAQKRRRHLTGKKKG